MNKKRLIALFIIFLAAGAMFYGGRKLLETEQTYQEINAVYDDIRDSVVINIGYPDYYSDDSDYSDYSDEVTAIQAGSEEKKESSETPAREIYTPGLEINFNALTSINADAAAWLYSPGTAINYPVMKANDYSYYLNHLPNGQKSAGGSLFIDYNCASDFRGKLTVIYGHHMKSGSMFGSLLKYKEQSYYKKHPVMYLYTEQGDYRIDLLYGCLISAEQWRERAFIYEENTDALLSYAAENTTFKSGLPYAGNDRLIVLSTCSYEFDGARYFLIGKLVDLFK